jgi:hypothetical protein
MRGIGDRWSGGSDGERGRKSGDSFRDRGEPEREEERRGSGTSRWSGYAGGSRHFGGSSGSQRYGVASSQGYGGAVERQGYGGFGSEGDRSGRGRFGYSREAYGSDAESRGHAWDRSGSEWAGGERGGDGGSPSPTFRHGSLRKRSPKGYTRSDERIREDVCDRLTESYLECEEVTVTVKNGEVVLGGRAPSGETRRQIERVAEGVTGVQDVTNQIRTRRDAGEPDDSEEQRKQKKEGRKTV